LEDVGGSPVRPRPPHPPADPVFADDQPVADPSAHWNHLTGGPRGRGRGPAPRAACPLPLSLWLSSPVTPCLRCSLCARPPPRQSGRVGPTALGPRAPPPHRPR